MKKIIYTSLLTLALLPAAAFAATQPVTNFTAVPAGQTEFGAPTTGPTYVLLAPLPCIGTTAGTVCNGGTAGNSEISSIGIQGYLLYLFKLIIAAAVFLAVVMTIFGGFKYMTVESVTGKSDAKQTIQHAVEGLLLALASYLILYTINPDLVNLSAVAIPKLNVAASNTVQNDLSNLTQNIGSNAQSQINQTAPLATQTEANLEADQNTVTNLQNQINSCVECTSEESVSLHTQLLTAQQNVTNDNDKKTTQVGVEDMDSYVVSAENGVSTDSNGSIQTNDEDTLSNLDGDISTLNDTYTRDTNALSNGDIADKQTLTSQYQYTSAILKNQQTLLEYQNGTINADQANSNIQAQNSIMADEKNSTLQTQYQTYSTAVQKIVTQKATQQTQSQSDQNSFLDK